MVKPATREIVVWKDPADRPDADATGARAEIQKAETAARLAVAKARLTHAKIQVAGMDFVLAQIEKWAKIAADKDFAMSIGPIDPATVMKLAEFVSKNFRLDNGQATENIAHAVTTSVDFSRLSQAERDEWRRLAKAAGVEEE
jgi:hypothetical protein